MFDLGHVLVNTVGKNKNNLLLKRTLKKAHSIKDIIGRPTTTNGNEQGSHYFLNLVEVIGQIAHAKWMISQIERMNLASKKHPGFVFTDENANIISDENDYREAVKGNDDNQTSINE